MKTTGLVARCSFVTCNASSTPSDRYTVDKCKKKKPRYPLDSRIDPTDSVIHLSKNLGLYMTKSYRINKHY